MTHKIPLDKRVWPGVVFLGILMILERIWHIPYAFPVLALLLVVHFLFFIPASRNTKK
jgi:hypothetical protein